MIKTDVDGIMMQSKGVLININPSSYEKEKNKMMDITRDKERINRLENDILDIKDVLAKILQKVS
jgi:hypothetical protein